MGIGIPGSGKTTILKNFAEKYGYEYVCPDDIRAEIGKGATDQSKNREVWDLAYARAKQKLEENKTVVFDATFASKPARKDFISFVKKNGAEKVQGIYLDVPYEVARERNSMRQRVVPTHVLERMQKNLDSFPPEINDGFDSLFTMDEYAKLSEVEVRPEHKNEIREIKYR